MPSATEYFDVHGVQVHPTLTDTCDGCGHMHADHHSEPDIHTSSDEHTFADRDGGKCRVFDFADGVDDCICTGFKARPSTVHWYHHAPDEIRCTAVGSAGERCTYSSHVHKQWQQEHGSALPHLAMNTRGEVIEEWEWV